MATALSEALALCALFCRFLGCDSGDSERPADDGDEVERGNEAEAERAPALEAEAAAAAARAACVTGMWMPRLGKDNDLRRVL
jgi:hypothetical protein